MVQKLSPDPCSLIKILTFVPLSYSSQGKGGTEEYAYSLIDELKENENQFQVALVTSCIKKPERRSTDIPRERKIDNLAASIESYLLLQRPVPKLRSIPVLIKIINLVHRSDLIHIHMPYPFIEAYVSALAKAFGKKVVVTYHMDAHLDSGTHPNKASPKDRLIEKLYYYLSSQFPLERASVICSNTRAYALESPILKKFMSKVVVIHQGINEQLFNLMDSRKASVLRSDLLLQNEYDYVISFVGRLVQYKGIPYLLDASKIINETTDLKIHFVIGGTGREYSRFVEISHRLGLRNVTFVGFVKDEDLFNLYRASDIVISPSISSLESTPISLLSALSCGTPVIGTTIGGTEETIPNDGSRAEIIAPKSAKDIASSICRLLAEDRDRVGLSEKKPLIPIRFWSDVAADYIDLFSRLVKIPVAPDDQIAFRR